MEQIYFRTTWYIKLKSDKNQPIFFKKKQWRNFGVFSFTVSSITQIRGQWSIASLIFLSLLWVNSRFAWYKLINKAASNVALRNPPVGKHRPTSTPFLAFPRSKRLQGGSPTRPPTNWTFRRKQQLHLGNAPTRQGRVLPTVPLSGDRRRRWIRPQLDVFVRCYEEFAEPSSRHRRQRHKERDDDGAEMTAQPAGRIRQEAPRTRSAACQAGRSRHVWHVCWRQQTNLATSHVVGRWKGSGRREATKNC